MAVSLEHSLDDRQEGCYKALLVVSCCYIHLFFRMRQLSTEIRSGLG